MSDDIEALTNEAMQAKQLGQDEQAAAAFAARDDLARALYPENHEPVASSGATAVDSVTPEALDQIREILVSTGNTDMADARLAGTVESALSFAQSFEKSNPVLANEIAELAQTDARIYSMVLKYCAAQGRAAPRQAPAPAARANPDNSYAPVAPILTHKESIESDIDAMLAQTPPGSRGYTDPKFQAKLQSLYRLLDDGPMVGRGGRNH